MVILARTLFSQEGTVGFRLIEGVDFSPLRGMSVSYEGSLMTTKTMVIAVGCTCKCLFITRMTHVTYIWLGFRMAIRLLFLGGG